MNRGFSLVLLLIIISLSIIAYQDLVNVYKIIPKTVILLPDRLTDVEIAEKCQNNSNNVNVCPNGDYVLDKTDALRDVFSKGHFLVYSEELKETGLGITTNKTYSLLYYWRNLWKINSGCNINEAKNGCEHI